LKERAVIRAGPPEHTVVDGFGYAEQSLDFLRSGANYPTGDLVIPLIGENLLQ